MDAQIVQRFPTVEQGEYIRAATLMEKFVYGDVEPEQFELRVLHAFLEKVYAPDWKDTELLERIFRPFRHPQIQANGLKH